MLKYFDCVQLWFHTQNRSSISSIAYSSFDHNSNVVS